MEKDKGETIGIVTAKHTVDHTSGVSFACQIEYLDGDKFPDLWPNPFVYVVGFSTNSPYDQLASEILKRKYEMFKELEPGSRILIRWKVEKDETKAMFTAQMLDFA